NRVSSARSSASNSANVQVSFTESAEASTRSSGTSRPRPTRCLGSTTRCVTSRVTGLTTTRISAPQSPSRQLTSTPIVNCVASAMVTLPQHPFSAHVGPYGNDGGAGHASLRGTDRTEDRERSAVAVPPRHLNRHVTRDLGGSALHHRRMHPEIGLLLELHHHGHVGTGRRGVRGPLVEQGEPLHGAAPAHLPCLDALGPAGGTHRSRGVDPVAAVETAIDEETVMEVALELTLVVVIEGHA